MRCGSPWVLIATLGFGCGDNSDECGPGTTAVDDVCVPSAMCGHRGTIVDPVTGACLPDGSVVCSNGTILDPATGVCVIDPNACQNGTVLIDDACVDPTKNLTIDVEEGPEPNGLGVLEASPNPAGIVASLKPVGGAGVVIHGHIDPVRDADQDGVIDPDDVDTLPRRDRGGADARPDHGGRARRRDRGLLRDAERRDRPARELEAARHRPRRGHERTRAVLPGVGRISARDRRLAHALSAQHDRHGGRRLHPAARTPTTTSRSMRSRRRSRRCSRSPAVQRRRAARSDRPRPSSSPCRWAPGSTR